MYLTFNYLYSFICAEVEMKYYYPLKNKFPGDFKRFCGLHIKMFFFYFFFMKIKKIRKLHFLFSFTKLFVLSVV